MCTVSFIPKETGFLLAMNRDESTDRDRALRPALRASEKGWAIYPSEPATGGTWVSVNSSGVALALLNWYSVRDCVRDKAVSRGEMVVNLTPANSSDEVAAMMGATDLSRTNPFRLLCVDPRGRSIVEWRWDLKSVNSVDHDWALQQWASSGFAESKAQMERRAVFCRSQENPDFGSLEWLRGLHASHEPEAGPFSHCMHRVDAATVSYSEILIARTSATMNYHDGSPCLSKELSSVFAELSVSF